MEDKDMPEKAHPGIGMLLIYWLSCTGGVYCYTGLLIDILKYDLKALPAYSDVKPDVRALPVYLDVILIVLSIVAIFILISALIVATAVFVNDLLQLYTKRQTVVLEDTRDKQEKSHAIQI
ncbi:hypothetical protein TorRG33x02_127510 [Trema orientale]|uniref:Uncharacterized protein n=1 Tax=Trema orientale TaxID=63057 RepID=A0A2P5F120_TREOI|nr:hypothetical protein TorRG33x02_127510 [Trema orientale]